MNSKLSKKLIGLGSLLVLLVAVFYILRIPKIAPKPPGNIHTWRQADCITVTDNLYFGEANIFRPKTNYVKQDGTRLTGGELPVFNYLVATVFKVTGRRYEVNRYLVFTFFVIGIIALYLMLFHFSGDPFLSVLGTLLTYGSSILWFYAINFLPDVPALSISVVGMYTLVLFFEKRSWVWLLMTFLTFTLATLMKITAGMMLAGAFFAILLQLVTDRKSKRMFPAIILMGISGIAVFIWYNYSGKLDHGHSPWIFLTETRSWWETSAKDKAEVWKMLRKIWLPELYIGATRYAFVLLGLLVAINIKRIPKYLNVLFYIVIAISAIFFFAMFRQFMKHDYYLVLLIILPVVLMVVAVSVISKMEFRYRFGFILGMFCLLLFQYEKTYSTLNERYFNFNNNWVYNTKLWEMRKTFEKEGISRDQLVISLPDNSPNITLMILDQHGFTDYWMLNSDSTKIQHNICSGAEFLVISDTTLYWEPHIKAFTNYPIEIQKTCGLFDLRPYQENCEN